MTAVCSTAARVTRDTLTVCPATRGPVSVGRSVNRASSSGDLLSGYHPPPPISSGRRIGRSIVISRTTCTKKKCTPDVCLRLISGRMPPDITEDIIYTRWPACTRTQVCVYIYIYNVIKCFGNCRRTGFTGGNTADTFVSLSLARAPLFIQILPARCTGGIRRRPSTGGPLPAVVFAFVRSTRVRGITRTLLRSPRAVDFIPSSSTGRKGRDDLGRPSGKTTAIGSGRNYVKTVRIEPKKKRFRSCPRFKGGGGSTVFAKYFY